jgi:3-deoxy-D-manno-octulosonate 8-phosphate phosphatase (KDO 8-P phosphatase)
LIKLLVLDVDGCLTDGGIHYTQSGDEFKTFNVKDGLAIASWIRLGGSVAIITGRESKIVQKRAKELGITHIYQGIKEKKKKLQELLKELGLGFENVAAIGDDLNDYTMLKSVKLSFTPNNGVDDIKDIVDITLSKNGGDGAIRQMIEYILKDQKQYEEFLNLWL